MPIDRTIRPRAIGSGLALPFQIAGKNLNISTSIGIAVCPAKDSDDVNGLLKKADNAMYAAKDAGRNGYKFYLKGQGQLSAVETSTGLSTE